MDNYPAIFVITGNDDPAAASVYIDDLENYGLITFLNNRIIDFKDIRIFGYPYVPPTPFQLKDWEKYDVSRFVPRGAVSPEEGFRTIQVPLNIIQHSTIKDDLLEFSLELKNFNKVIGLFHTPPNDTNLDKLIGKDINGNKQLQSAGSFAVRRFIESSKPKITLHGHLHESADLSGSWNDRIGETYCFNAAQSGEKLALVKLDTDQPEKAIRILL
jgi:Icc-related predicted phosphoesterase